MRHVPSIGDAIEVLEFHGADFQERWAPATVGYADEHQVEAVMASGRRTTCATRSRGWRLAIKPAR